MTSLLRFPALLFVVGSLLKLLVIASPLDKQKSSYKACGTHLANILANECEGVYNENKRTPNSPMIGIEEPDYYYNYDSLRDFSVDSSYPFRRRRSIPAVIRAVKMKRDSARIVEECCQKSCKLDELLGYCGSFRSSGNNFSS